MLTFGGTSNRPRRLDLRNLKTTERGRLSSYLLQSRLSWNPVPASPWGALING